MGMEDILVIKIFRKSCLYVQNFSASISETV